MEDLRRKGLVQAGEGKITVHIVGKAPAVLEGLDGDHFASFLQTLRQFMLEGEPVNYYSICNLAYRKCNQAELQKWLTHSRSAWSQIMTTSPLGISINGHCPTVSELLDLFLYGGMIHSDPGHAKKLRELSPQIQGLMKMMLMSGIGDLCQSLALMDKILWHWLDAPGETIPTFREAT